MFLEAVMLGAVSNSLLALLRRERIEGEGGAHGICPHPCPPEGREMFDDVPVENLFPFNISNDFGEPVDLLHKILLICSHGNRDEVVYAGRG